MKKSLFFLAMLFVSASIFATEYKLTITSELFSEGGYTANNGEHTWNAVATDGSEAQMEVVVVSYQIMKQAELIQGKKKQGYLYNKTSLGKITSITIENNTNFSDLIGNEEKPAEAVENGAFFKISAGGSVSSASSMVIVFEKTDAPTAIEENKVEETAMKFIEDGQLVIVRDGVRYNVAGQAVK